MTTPLVPKFEQFGIGALSPTAERYAPRLGMPSIESLVSDIDAYTKDTGYSRRKDGTSKGAGYYGELARPDGGVSTELSIGVLINGKETELPLLVPTLTKDEINHALAGKAPTTAMVNKAVDHAKQRWDSGKSQWAEPKDRLIARPNAVGLPGPNVDLGLREGIASLESRGSGDYKARAKGSSFLGRYQLGTQQLKQIGYKNADGSWTGKNGINSAKDFLNSPDVQDRAYAESISEFDRQLQVRGTYKYVGKTVNTALGKIELTPERILAAAHNAGAKGVHDWLSGKTKEPRDKLGTPASKFMLIVK
jgi:hypothetical protein